MKYIYLGIVLLFPIYSQSQVNQAKVYWVGHSLISHTDYNDQSYKSLILLLGDMASSQSKTYDHHKHTIPGAPIGWNWNDQTLIDPLTNPANTNYGTYDVIVLTEAIELSAHHLYWNSSFYARKFYNAARRANPDARLFMYQSWHNYHGTDDASGAIADFDFKNYMTSMRLEWEEIIEETNDPNRTQFDANYTYAGTGEDPGLGDAVLDVCMIPTGAVLIDVLDRLEANLAGDDWSYNGGQLTGEDFFQNPLANFPTDTVTAVDPSNQLDDIHASNVLAYLNSLVHYAVIYQDNPANLPAANGVPDNIATILKEVTWENVTNDPLTCLSTSTNTENPNNEPNGFALYPNPASTSLTIDIDERGTYQIINLLGQIVLEGSENTVDIRILAPGIYFVKANGAVNKLIKQ